VRYTYGAPAPPTTAATGKATGGGGGPARKAPVKGICAEGAAGGPRLVGCGACRAGLRGRAKVGAAGADGAAALEPPPTMSAGTCHDRPSTSVKTVTLLLVDILERSTRESAAQIYKGAKGITESALQWDSESERSSASQEHSE
jgi:hypothetical protein